MPLEIFFGVGAAGALLGPCLVLNRGGEGCGVGGGREVPSSAGEREAGGPRMRSRTGKKTRPLYRPSTIRATSTKKKYLQKR